MVWRGQARALLLLSILAPMLLAGCHDLTQPTPLIEEAPAPAPGAPDVDPIPIDNPLPHPRLSAAGDRAEIALQIHIDGDPASIAHHAITWGDGTGFAARPGPPATRYTHTYPQPRSWSGDAMEFTPKLTIYSSAGHTRSATIEVTIPPPPNRPPQGSLLVPTPPEAVPARTTIQIQSHDPDGAIRSWTLDTGDGTTTLRDHETPPDSIVHVYRRIGPHTATLTLTDDAGATTTAETTIVVPPPQDHLIWTLSQTNGTLYQHTPDGSIAATRAPFGICGGEPCDRIIGAAAQRDTLAVLIEHDTDSSTTFLDATTGRHLGTVALPAAPQDIHADGTGRYWTTHGDGTITWFRHGSDAPLGQVTLPATNAQIRLVFGTDGVAWALVSDITSRLYRLDPVEGSASPLFLPIPAQATQLALNHKHNLAVVVTEDARAWIAGPSAAGPLLLRTVQIAGTDPAGTACPPTGDLCWVALAGPSPRVVPIDLRAQATTTTAGAGTRLPDGSRPTSVTAHQDRLLLATSGDTPRVLLLDAKTGAVTAETTKESAARFLAHPAHPTLVYHAHPDGHWAIIDVDAGREVHESVDAGGDLGPFLTERPWRPGAT